jgi:preprotein translocase SecE subunit
VDLLIDTEQEMKKVSWPSRKEVQSATLVVVLVTVTMAMLLFGFDEILQALFGLVW